MWSSFYSWLFLELMFHGAIYVFDLYVDENACFNMITSMFKTIPFSSFHVSEAQALELKRNQRYQYWCNTSGDATAYRANILTKICIIDV
jgi:hypothetical protein